MSNFSSIEAFFKCRKCGHLVRISTKLQSDKADVQLFLLKLSGMLDHDCPNCGEEAYENWLLYDVDLETEPEEA